MPNSGSGSRPVRIGVLAVVAIGLRQFCCDLASGLRFCGLDARPCTCGLGIGFHKIVSGVTGIRWR